MIPDWRIFINIATTPIKHGGGCFPGRAYIPPPYPPLFMDGSCPQRSSSAQWVNETPPCLFMTRRDEAQVCGRRVTGGGPRFPRSPCSLSSLRTRCPVSIAGWQGVSSKTSLLLLLFFLQTHGSSGRLQILAHTRKPQALRGFEEWRLLQSHVGAFNLPCNFYVM